MRFEIGLVKKLAIALAMVVSAGDALAASVSPMYFANVGSSYSVNSEKQEAFWTDLMKYKIFGAQGIYFLGQSIRVTDKSGWFGTAAGNFDMSSGNMHHVIGGPVLIGGNMIMSDGTDSITSGPVRVLGNITIPNETNWRGTGNVTAGYHCVGGTIANEFKKIMRADSSYSNDECPTAVPVINSDLRIPLLNAEKSYDNGIDLNNETKNIDIPAGEGTYDLYLDYINFVNKSYLNIRMPNKGRLTRIFLKNGFPSITSDTRIRVVYMSEDARYNNSTKEWASGTETYVINKNYAGNLLFYTNKDIDFDALSSTDSIQGSFITTGTINVRQSMTLAGQLLADKVTINAFFDGSGFHYVPFDPPELGDPETNSWGTLEEGIKTPQALSVVLSKAPETDVSFKYCFEFKGTENRDAVDENDVYASLDDIVKDANRIVCNGESVFGTATFKAGSTKLSEPIVLTVFDDGFVENEEHFSIHIFDLEGAVMADQSREGRFDISIKDNDDVLSGQDETINATEDTPYIFGKSDFTVLTRKGETWTGDYSIRILEVSGKGALTIDKKAVELVPSKDILDGKLFGGLIYTPADNDYGSARATFTFVVVRGENIVSEDPYTMTINVTPVNDAPVLSPVTFKIKENVVRGDVNGDDYATGSLSAVIEDVDDDEFTYKFDDTFDAENTEENYKKVTSLYDLDPVTGKIVVHEDAVLNYESADSLLQIRVVATDKSSSTKNLSDAKSGKTIITIQMLDVNEKPTIAENQSFSIVENPNQGATIGTVKATDPDRSTVDFGKLVFSIPVNDDEDESNDLPFKISASGVLTVTDSTKFDYEKVKSFTFDVVVGDKGNPSLKDTAKVTITLENVDEIPEIVCLEGDKNCEGPFDVLENSKTDSIIHSFGVIDEDKDEAYSLEKAVLTDTKNTGAEALFYAKFNDDKSQVSIVVKDKSKLDYEKINASYTVKISIVDASGTEASITRVIKVVDVNEAPTAENFTKTIAENRPNGFEVGTVKASDPDTKNATFSKLTYSIPVNEDADKTNDVPFAINKTTGVITVTDSSKLDYETTPKFTFKVEVKDIEYTAVSTVTINLDDEEEDPDIIECDPDKEVCCDPNVKVCCDPAKEVCDDPPPPDTTCKVNCGYVKGDTLYVNVRENSATGTQILKYYVKDQDKGDLESMEVRFENLNKSGADTLFKLTDGLVKDEDGNYYFRLNVADGSKLDYEKVKESHTLRIIVEDDGGKADSIVRVVKVVDLNEKPEIKDDTKNIKENLPNGTPVDTLKASDPDIKNKAFSTLTYTILDAENVPFYLDTKNPTIVKVKDRTQLNYEKNPTFTFYVQVSDGTLADTAKITLKLTDEEEPPDIIPDPECDETKEDCCDPNLEKCKDPDPVPPDTSCKIHCGYFDGDTMYVYVRENTATGTPILTYYVKDEDVGDLDAMVVSFKDMNKSGSDSLFTVAKLLDKDAKGNYSFTLKVKDGSKLDYEKVSESHRILITVKDDAGLTDTILRVIKIMDVNEAVSIKDASFKVDENSENGVLVGSMKASDLDILHPEIYAVLKYSVVEEGTPFKMDSNKVRVADGTMLNYEQDSIYVIHVRVTDGEFSDTAKVTIKLNNTNEEPFIKCLTDDTNCEGPYNVEENSPTNTVIHTFAVMDDDKDPLYRLNSATIADMKGTNAKDLFAIKFNKDSSQVTVYVKDGSKLDYEKVYASYTVKIKISDAMGVADSVIRVINVIDVNEEPSIADSTFKVAENTKNGTVVGSLRASDPDIKNVKFSTLSYEVIDDVPFKMDSNKVVVADSKALNYEKVTEFYFDVRVTDGGGLTDIATVYVKLTDEEEPPEIIIVPECDPAKEICHTCDAMIEDCDDPDDPPDTTCTENCGYVKNDTVYVNVRENSATGTKILEYYVKDEDAGDLQSMEVSFKDMNKSGSDTLFTITPALIKDDKGFKFILTVTDGDKLDYEKTNHVHVLTITVKDDAGLTDKIVRVINIVDVNEPPYIVKDEFDLNEHNKVGAVVGTIEWGDDRDMDGVSNPAFRDNRVVAVDGATDVFDVDSMGVITVKKTLNYETDDTTYTLNVKVEDKNDPTLSSSETMIIHLKNVLETPVITSTEFTIAENPADRAVIGTLTSEDMDDLKNEEKRTYTLIGTSDYVKVTEDGEIVVVNKDKFDFEKIESFTIKVKVTDPQKVSSDTTVTIKITDVNEAPNLDDKVITVSEHTAPKTDIDTLKATDPDTKKKEFRDLTYTIVDGDTSLFKVDPKTGVVTLKDSLDYETAKEHILKVEVNDGEFADTAKITVAVENVIERSVVEIQMVDDGDSVFVRPDSVFTNRPDVTICWTEDARDYCQDTTLTEGIHTIIKTYKDPKKDFAGADTVVIQLSTSAPQVIISAKADDLGDGGIFTLDETVIAGDTNIYVKDSKNDIKVTIKDPVNKKDSSFTVKLDLETVNVSSKDLESVSSVLDQGKLTLNENPKIPASRTPVNGSEVRVDYTEEVNGKTVTVTYYTDKNGEVLKTPVIIDGKVDSIEVITVSYKTEIGGREVVVSYQADAVTGQVLNVASDGALTTDDKIEVAVVPDGKPSESDTTVSKTTDVSVGSFKVTYEYEDEKHNTVVVTYTVDEKGNIVKNADGDIGYNVSYTYENKFGNAATQSVFIVLDQTPPVVKIVSPVMMEKIRANSVEVVWTVNGVVQDTLTLQGLKKGFQKIKREYRDKAGNVAADSVTVQVKDAKSMDIEVVEAVTEMDLEKVEEYYASNPPKKGETFAISVENPSTGKELEVLTGGSYGQEDGSFDTPYPGVEGNGHLGPTVAMEIRLPVVNDVAGLATFDDLVLSDGTISSRGVNSDRCKTADEYEAMGLDVDSLAQDTTVCVKFTQEQYVEKYCEDDFDISGDLSKINMYTTKMHAKVWIYTSLGGFVDYYGFKIDLDDPEYTDKAGVLNMYFEQKPDKDGEVRTEDGRVLSTGAYLYKVEADIRAKLRCSLPPFEPKANGAGKMKGQVLKKSDELLKPFGYKRPVKK